MKYWIWVTGIRSCVESGRDKASLMITDDKIRCGYYLCFYEQGNGTLSLKGDAWITNHELDLGTNMNGYITPVKTEMPLSTAALFILMALVSMFITGN